jgi:hypothetical protein
MSIVQFREGKYKLTTFQLNVPGGRKLGLAPYCARADIYESVLEPTTIAEFVISDKVDMYSHFNFLELSIDIEFTTYEDNDQASVKYTFYPIIVDPAAATPDDKGIVYKITCVSQEALKSTQIKNLSLVKEKIDCETMINALLQLIGSKKQYFPEKTQGLHAFNFTLVNPFTAIDEVRLKAMSSEFQGHCFLFYENSKGYHFRSFEGLIKEGLTKIGDKYYTQSAAVNISIAGTSWRNILAFKSIQTGNENVTRALGAGKIVVKKLNQISQQTEDINIDPTRLNFVQLNKNSISINPATQNELAKNEGKVVLIHFDPTVETAETADAAAKRAYYLSFLFNTVAHITVYGDTTVTIGDVITLKIPEFSALTLGEDRPFVDTNVVAAGNYLVTKCHHVLTFGEGAEYMQGLEIVKDGYGGDAPKAISYV